MSREKRKSIVKEAQGILRTEVGLKKAKIIQSYSDADDVSGQIMELSKNYQNVFMGTFTYIIPFEDLKKG